MNRIKTKSMDNSTSKLSFHGFHSLSHIRYSWQMVSEQIKHTDSSQRLRQHLDAGVMIQLSEHPVQKIRPQVRQWWRLRVKEKDTLHPRHFWALLLSIQVRLPPAAASRRILACHRASFSLHNIRQAHTLVYN